MRRKCLRRIYKASLVVADVPTTTMTREMVEICTGVYYEALDEAWRIDGVHFGIGRKHATNSVGVSSIICIASGRSRLILCS